MSTKCTSKYTPNERILARQLRSQKGVAAKLRKEKETLRLAIAVKEPQNVMLLAIMRQNNIILELLQELLDSRKETIVTEHQPSPHIHDRRTH